MADDSPVLTSPPERHNSRRNPDHGNVSKISRAHSLDSASADEWGFFEDFEPSTPLKRKGDDGSTVEEQPIQRALSLPPPATTAPMYVLESTLATQQLWYSTAGLRPRQPERERLYFENLWKRNFTNSDVPGIQSLVVDDACIVKQKKVHILGRTSLSSSTVAHISAFYSKHCRLSFEGEDR